MDTPKRRLGAMCYRNGLAASFGAERTSRHFRSPVAIREKGDEARCGPASPQYRTPAIVPRKSFREFANSSRNVAITER